MAMSTLPDEDVEVPDPPAVPGLRFRHLHAPEDYVGMAAANQRARDDAGIEEVITAERMARDYAHHVNCDPVDDILVVERDGVIAGYGRTEWRDLEDGTRSFTVMQILAPEHVATGAYRSMLGWAERRAVAKARAIPQEERRPSLLRASTFGAELDLIALLESTAWTRNGSGYEMVRPTLDDIPDAPMPAGLRVRPVSLDPAARRVVWDAASEAFADERAESSPTEADWLAHLEDPYNDPALGVIAYDGDEIAGGAEGRIDPAENAHHGRERGLVAGVWTRRPWRRRGLARALIARCLVRLRDHGMTSAYLSVDGLNPNQAMTLYTSLGFEVASTSYDWTKPLPADAAPPADPAPAAGEAS